MRRLVRDLAPAASNREFIAHGGVRLVLGSCGDSTDGSTAVAMLRCARLYLQERWGGLQLPDSLVALLVPRRGPSGGLGVSPVSRMRLLGHVIWDDGSCAPCSADARLAVRRAAWRHIAAARRTGSPRSRARRGGIPEHRGLRLALHIDAALAA